MEENRLNAACITLNTVANMEWLRIILSDISIILCNCPKHYNNNISLYISLQETVGFSHKLSADSQVDCTDACHACIILKEPNMTFFLSLSIILCPDFPYTVPSMPFYFSLLFQYSFFFQSFCPSFFFCFSVIFPLFLCLSHLGFLSQWRENASLSIGAAFPAEGDLSTASNAANPRRDLQSWLGSTCDLPGLRKALCAMKVSQGPTSPHIMCLKGTPSSLELELHLKLRCKEWCLQCAVRELWEGLNMKMW